MIIQRLNHNITDIMVFFYITVFTNNNRTRIIVCIVHVIIQPYLNSVFSLYKFIFPRDKHAVFCFVQKRWKCFLKVRYIEVCDGYLQIQITFFAVFGRN